MARRRRGFEDEETRWIAPAVVRRDPEINRLYEPGRAERMVKAGFDARRARSAGYVVSQRDNGDLIWLDGQHRGNAAVMAEVGDVEVPMTVLHGLSKAEEAEWVLLFQEDKKRTTPVDAHRLGVEAGRSTDVALHAVCEKHGVKADGGSGAGRLPAVSTARRIVDRKGGVEVLDQALSTLIATWGRDSSSFEAPLLAGAAHFWQNNNGNVDKAALVKKMAKQNTASGFLGTAKGLTQSTGRPLYREVAAVMVGAYNKGRRAGALPPL